MAEDNFAEEHVNALYSLIGYLIERCPKQCDEEMERRFDALLSSFGKYAAENAEDPLTVEDIVHQDELGQNYLIAHAALLQMYVNRIRSAAENGKGEAVPEIIRELDQRTDQNFTRFFGEPLDLAT